MKQIADNEKVALVVTPAAGAAGTTDIDSAIVDMAGFEGVVFEVTTGPIVTNAVTSCVVQQNSANATEGMASLAGSTVTIADDDDNQLILIEVMNPKERFVRLHIDRATQNATIGSVVARLIGPRTMPVVNDDATVHSITQLISPEEA